MIAYYVFDGIETIGNQYWAYKGQVRCPVEILQPGETDQSLVNRGFARCDLPSDLEFVVDESVAKRCFGLPS